MRANGKKQYHYIVFALAFLAAFLFAFACPNGASTYAESYAPVITLVSQSSNETYAKSKSATITFEDVSTDETNGITDVTLDGISLGAISSYTLTVDENGSHTFTAVNYANLTSSLTVTFEKIHTLTVTVSSEPAVGTQTGAGEYTGGETYTVSTTAVSGYYFSGWTYSGAESNSLYALRQTVLVGEPQTSVGSIHYVAHYAEITTASPSPYVYYNGTTGRTVSFAPLSGFTASVSYLYSRDADGYWLNQPISAPIKAGTYTATISVVNDTTLETVGQKTVNISILRGTIDTLSFSAGSFVYDGAVKKLSVVGMLPDGTTAHIKSWQNNALTNAGTVTNVTAVIDGYNNYNDLTMQGGVITVARRTVTVTALSKNKPYGYDFTLTKRTPTGAENDPFSYEFVVSGGAGIVSGETLQGCFSLENPDVATGQTTAILQGTLNNDYNANYSITFIGATLTAVKRTMRILIDSAIYEYGEEIAPEISFTLLDSIKSGETLQGTPYNDAAAGSPAGIYPFWHHFTVLDSSETDTSENYLFVLTSSATEILLPSIEIAPRRLLVNAIDNQVFVYSGERILPALTITRPNGASSFALYGDDALEYLTYKNGAACDSYGAGGYTLLIQCENYVFYTESGDISREIRFSVLQKELTDVVYENAGNLIYNGSVQKSVAAYANGVYTKDADFFLSVRYNGNMKNAGSYAYIAYIDYAYTQNADYYLSPSLSQQTITIEKKSVQVSANGTTRKFAHANPDLTYTSAGLIAGDTLYGRLVSAAEISSPVGTYDITLGSLLHPDYDIDYLLGTLEIIKEDLVLTANDTERYYYDDNPVFTFRVKEGVLLPGITLSGSLYSYADQYSDCGEYAVYGSFTHPDYNVGFIPGTLTVVPRPVQFAFYNDNLFRYDGFDKKGLAGVVSHNIPEPIGAGINYTVNKSSPSQWIAAGEYTFTVALYGVHVANYLYENGTVYTVKLSAMRALVTVENQVVTFGNSILQGRYSVVSENSGAVMSVALTLTAEHSGAGDHYGAIGVIEQKAVVNSVLYDLVVCKGNLTVLKRPLTLTWGNTLLHYNGTVQNAPAATLAGEYGDVYVDVTTDAPLLIPGIYVAAAEITGADAKNHYLPANVTTYVVISKAATSLSRGGSDAYPVFTATGENRKLTYSVNGGLFSVAPPYCPDGAATAVTVRAAENECYFEKTETFIINRIGIGGSGTLTNSMVKTPSSYVEINALGQLVLTDIAEKAGYIASALADGQTGAPNSLSWNNVEAGDQYFVLFYFNVALSDANMAYAAENGQITLSLHADWYADFVSSALGTSRTNMLFAAIRSIGSPSDYTADYADNTFNNKQYSLGYSSSNTGSWMGVNRYGGLIKSAVIHGGNATESQSGNQAAVFDHLTLPGRYFRLYFGIAVASNSRDYGSDYSAINAGEDNLGALKAGFSNISLSAAKKEFSPVLEGETPYTKITADNKYPAYGPKTYSFSLISEGGIPVTSGYVTVNTNRGVLTLENGGLFFAALSEDDSKQRVTTKALFEYTQIISVTVKDPYGAEYTLTHAHNENNTHYFDAPVIYGAALSTPSSASGWVTATQTLSFYVSPGYGAPVSEVKVNGAAVFAADGLYTCILPDANEFTVTATNAENLTAAYYGRALFDTVIPDLTLSRTENSGVWMLADYSSEMSLASGQSPARLYYRKAVYGTLIENAVWYGIQNVVFTDSTALYDFIYRLTAEGYAQDTLYQFKIVTAAGKSASAVFNYKIDRRNYAVTYIDKWYDGTDAGAYSLFLNTATGDPAGGSYPRGSELNVTIKSVSQNNVCYGLQLSLITVVNTASVSSVTFTTIEEYMEYRSNVFTLSVDNPDTVAGVTITAIFKNYVLYQINDALKDFGDSLPVFSVSVTKGTPEIGTTQYGITTTATAMSPLGPYRIYAAVRISTSQILCYRDGVLTVTKRKIKLSGTVTKVYDRSDTASSASFTFDRVLFGDDVTVASVYYANREINAGTHPLTITLGGADLYKYELVYPQGQSAYYGTITPYGLTATGGQTTYVFDGAVKHYAPAVSGVLPGDTAPTFTFLYENGVVPVFAGFYRAIGCVSSNPNYTVISYPEGIHLTITANNTLSAQRIITSAGEYRILLVLQNMVSDYFAALSDPQILYSVNGSSYFKIETDRYYAAYRDGVAEITYLGKPGMREDLADFYSFQIGIDDGYEHNDSTNFTSTASALASGQADSYYTTGTPIDSAEGLKNFLNGTGNGYLCTNIYDFDWGGGGSVLLFETGRILDGNGFTVFLTGDYTQPEMTQPVASFVSFKSWNASGLFVGINQGTIQNIHFKYVGNRSYPADTFNSANSGRAIGFISGANSGTIRNTVIILDGNFNYKSTLGISFGFLAVGGIAGVAYENSTIINCTVEHISGTYAFENHANNTKTYLAFGGAVGFMNGSGNAAKTNGYYNNAALINSRVTGNQTNIVLSGRFVYGGGLIGCSATSSNNSYSAGVVDGVINSYSGQIIGNTTGYNGNSFKNIGMVGGHVTYIYNVYNTYQYNHVNLSGLKNVPNSISIGRDTPYLHVVAFSGAEKNETAWGDFPSNLISTGLPSVRIDTSVTPNVPMGNGFINFYFDKLNDGNKPGNLQTEIIAYFRTFIWDVRSTLQSAVYSIANYIPDIINNADLENTLLLRWVYSQALGSQIVLDVSFGTRAYGTVDGVVNGYLYYTYNGRNQRENVMEAIKLKDESGNLVDGYELIVNAPYNMKDAGTYVVTFVNIVSGTGSAGEGFVFDENKRSLIYISSLDEQSNAIQVVIEKKDAWIINPFPVEILKEYDGTDFMLYSAQFYLEGFTEVLASGETSPLSIRFIFTAGNVNAVNNALVTADLVYQGDPYSAVPYNYNLIGIIEFLASIVPRTVTVNIPFETGELPYVYCGKEYDGTDIFNKIVTLNNVLTHLDPDIGVIGKYFENEEAELPSRTVGDSKILRFMLLNDVHGNYKVAATQQSYLTQIYKRSITVVNENLNKIYDSSVYMNEAQLQSIRFDRMIASDDLRAAIGVYSDKNAGENKYITLTLGGSDSINYELITAEGQLNYSGSILQKELAVLGSISKVYNKNSAVNTGSLTLYGVCGGDSVLFYGVYQNGQYQVCENDPILFTISGTDAANYVLDNHYTGSITPLYISITGVITKVYDKTDTVQTSMLSLSYNLDGENLGFSGVYQGGRTDAGALLPVMFTLTGTASGNYAISGEYYGAITKRAVSILLQGEITKVYDQSAQVVFPYTGFAVLEGNMDGENLTFYARYQGEQKSVVYAHPVVFTLTGSAAGNYTLAGTYFGNITAKLITVSYQNIDQCYREDRKNVLVTVDNGQIYPGDTVNAYVDMSRIALTHNRFTVYADLFATLDNANYSIGSVNKTALTFRYFRFADEENFLYQIETMSDFAMIGSLDFFADYLTLDYILINDIDNGRKAFAMIDGEYSGTFYGNNKVISGLTLIAVNTTTDGVHQPLAPFCALSAEGVIRDLKIVNTSLNNYGDYTVTGGIAAYNEGNIVNCMFEGEIYAGTEQTLEAAAGGIAGISSGSIENCKAVTVTVIRGGVVSAGGIAGSIYEQAAVISCTGFAEISAVFYGSAYTGGVIGYNGSEGEILSNSYLADAAMVNGEFIEKAVGNAADEEGVSYADIVTEDTALSSFVYQYRIAQYAPAAGSLLQPIFIHNYRQIALLSQFRFANFVLSGDIVFPSGYLHTPEKGVFFGRLTASEGCKITLPGMTPEAYKKLFEYEREGAIEQAIYASEG